MGFRSKLQGIGIVITFALAAMRWHRGRHVEDAARHDDDDGALDVLRRQYARGDIDHEEFDARRKRLQA